MIRHKLWVSEQHVSEHVLQKYHVRPWRALVWCEAGIKPRPMQHSPLWPGAACAFSTRRISLLFFTSLFFLNKYNHYKHIWSHTVAGQQPWVSPRDAFYTTDPWTHTLLNTLLPAPATMQDMHCMSIRKETHWAQQKLKLSFRPCSIYICPVKYCMQPGGDWVKLAFRGLQKITGVWFALKKKTVRTESEWETERETEGGRERERHTHTKQETGTETETVWAVKSYKWKGTGKVLAGDVQRTACRGGPFRLYSLLSQTWHSSGEGGASQGRSGTQKIALLR